MQAMIPMPPAPAKTAPKAPKPSSPVHADRSRKSFDKHLDTAEDRLDKSDNVRARAADDHKAKKAETAHPDAPQQDNVNASQTQQSDNVIVEQVAAGQSQPLQELLRSLTVNDQDSTPAALTPVVSETALREDMGTQVGQGREQLLSKLLDRVTGADLETSQNLDKLASQLQVEKTEEGQVRIEQWQARFSYKDTQPLAEMNTPGSEQTSLPKGLQVQVNPEFTEQAAPARPTSGTSVEGAQQPRDTTSNYIHSNLPGIQTERNQGEGSTFGQEGQSMGQEAQENGPQNTATATQNPDSPLIFSLDQAGQTGTLRGSEQATQTATLRLPSGAEVPHSHIVNQVTDHFSVNRNLESGSVVLRLHPAELGELRMEIKVEQDNIKAHITTHNPQVQDILDRNIPRLREILEQQGMNLEHIQVSVAADDGGSGQFFQEQFAQQQFSGNLRHNTGSSMHFTVKEEEPEIPLQAADEQSLSVHA